MWPFSRKEPAPPDGGPSLPQVRFDWKHLPAIQRTVSNHPLTVQTASFARGLATHADPRTVAEPLSHAVSLAAPPGLILDFVRPQTRDVGPELVGRSRGYHQRPVQRVRTESAVPDVDEGQMPPAFDDIALRAEEPIRRLAAAAEARPPVSLMRVSAETEPTPLPATLEAPAPVETSLDSAEPVSAGRDSTAEIPARPRLTLGQVRRLGLGAPIARVPDTASTVQRGRESDPVESVAPAQAPEPAPMMERGPIAEAPQFQPFALDYLITKKSPPRAPTPISRRPRITPAITVSRSAADEASAETPAAPESDRIEGPIEHAEAESTESPASTASTPVERESALTDEEPVPAVQRMVDSREVHPDHATDGIDLPGIDRNAEAPVQRSATAEVAGATPTVDPAASTILRSAPPTGETGEAAEGPVAELPALPLAARGALPSVQHQATAADKPASRDEQPAPLVSSGPAIATLSATLTVPPQAKEGKGMSGSELTSGASVPRPLPAPAPRAEEGGSALTTVSRTIAAAQRPSVQRAAELSAPTRPIAIASALPLASRSGLALTTLEPKGPFASAASAMVEAQPPTPTLPPRAGGGSTDPDGVKRDPEFDLPLAPVARASEATPAIQRISSAAPDHGHASFLDGISPGTPEPSPLSNLPAVIQRSARQEWSVQTEPADGAPAGEAALSAEAGHAAGPSSADHTDLDALATRLYDKIRLKLRHELLIDRERAGLLTDLR